MPPTKEAKALSISYFKNVVVSVGDSSCGWTGGGWGAEKEEHFALIIFHLLSPQRKILKCAF